MRADVRLAKIEELAGRYHTISYPEFQREPTVWGIRQKKLLIDSILRKFDIGNIYVVADEEWGTSHWQCIDGRQRLSAIFSFMGINKEYEEHNDFPFEPSNEVREDGKFADIDGLGFNDPRFSTYKDEFLKYKVKVVVLSSIEEETELNLQFQRLQIAQILNGAEKLNAMVGEMRDAIFDKESGLGLEPYFDKLGVRRARFGPQQTASQIMINACSLLEFEEFCRARFLDMQMFFKRYFKFDDLARTALEKVRESARSVTRLVGDDTLRMIKNRALAVSLVLFVFEHDRNERYTMAQWEYLESYLQEVAKGLATVSRRTSIRDPDVEPGPWERLQLAITQASVEERAIRTRHEILTELFDQYLDSRLSLPPDAN